MIRPLRRRHRRMVVVLAVVLPALFLFALRARRPLPEVNALVETVDRVGRLDGTPVDVALAWSTDDGIPEIAARVWSEGRVLELLPAADPARPDVLVYWQPARSGTPGAGSLLLGAMAGDEPRRFRLPDEARRADGHLLLWSVTDAAPVASAALPATGGDR